MKYFFLCLLALFGVTSVCCSSFLSVLAQEARVAMTRPLLRRSYHTITEGSRGIPNPTEARKQLKKVCRKVPINLSSRRIKWIDKGRGRYIVLDESGNIIPFLTGKNPVVTKESDHSIRVDLVTVGNKSIVEDD